MSDNVESYAERGNKIAAQHAREITAGIAKNEAKQWDSATEELARRTWLMNNLAVGTIGVTPTFGNGFDKFVATGIQWFTATRDDYSKAWTNAKVNHAVVYVGSVDGIDDGYPQLVEARPGGAGFARADSYGDHMIWLNHLVQAGTDHILTVTDAQRMIVREYAVDCAVKKIGYNYLDFVAIALAQKRFGDTGSNWYKYGAPWWVKRLSNDHRLICSQLVDEAYQRAGVKLFNDGRPSGLVSPADLYAIGSLTA